MGHLLKACQTYKSRDMRQDNAFLLTDSSIVKEPPLLSKNHFKSEDIIYAITLVLIFSRVSIVEKNEFQNRVFLFSNFLGAAILNNCDVSWLPFCY